MKLVLGMEVGLGPVHIVLDGDYAPSPKGFYAYLCVYFFGIVFMCILYVF